MLFLVCAFATVCFSGLSIATNAPCITYHKDISPGEVADWKPNKHSKEDVTCSVCHGQGHQG
jgi:hypothetical protein